MSEAKTPGPGGGGCVILHYNEIGLKGKNRPFFIRLLAQRVERAAAGTGGTSRVRKLHGRLLLEIPEDSSWACGC